jgi:hypothetical protein
MDLQTLRSELGLETHGKVVTEFDPAPLGLVTFRVHGTKKPWEVIPMLGNPLMSRTDIIGSSDSDPYFWKKGTFRGVEDYGWAGDGSGYGCFTQRGDGTGFMRLVWTTAMPAVAKGIDDKSVGRPDHPDQFAALQIGAVPTKTMSAQGLAYWSVTLPTTDGAQIDLSLWVRAKDVKAARENGGLFVTVEFCDETGQNVTRQYLVGADDGQKAAGADFATGDYAYKQLKGTVTAPSGARWFKMGFGLRDCTGWMAFSDADIQTRPGMPQEVARKVLPIDASKFAWTVCDLTGLLNRPLADESGSGGKVGWTDQGPLMDLRNLLAGDYTYNDVAFHVAKGNACFIMKNKFRPSQNLPDGGKVDLKARADVLAFLHTGGWIYANVSQAMYIIHYDDGTKVEIPIVGGRNIFDWVASPDHAADLKYDPAYGLLLPATTVASPQFVRVTVWTLLWKNPHPDKTIASLEIKGANQGAPGLIAVSRGVAK